MNTSLPFLPPRDSHTLWYTPIHFPPSTSTHGPTSSSSSQSNAQPDRHPKSTDRPSWTRPSALAQLVADEAEIRRRKANVARFGATWIRPPGISKTYQAMVDEAAERLEQEALAAREQAAAEQQAAWEAQEEEARRVAMTRARQADRFGAELGEGQRGGFDGGDEVDDDGMGMGERDLDEDVPDAEDDTFGLSGEDDDDDNVNEVDLDATDEADLMEGERDLDDDVPEAGSYQHTDTDVEDESTDAGFSSPARGQPTSSAGNRPSSPVGQGPTVVQDFRQPSLDTMPIPRFTSSPVQAESSMLASSPGIPRARTQGQARHLGNRRGLPAGETRPPDFRDYGQP